MSCKHGQDPASTLQLGTICERLGVGLTDAFLCDLGFEPAFRDDWETFYYESDFALICDALMAHIEIMKFAHAEVTS